MTPPRENLPLRIHGGGQDPHRIAGPVKKKKYSTTTTTTNNNNNNDDDDDNNNNNNNNNKQPFCGRKQQA
jgi:hypothetical protein